MKQLLNNLVESFIRNISGGLGRRIRYLYYRKRFSFCGEKVCIDENVFFDCPSTIGIGNNVWIDRNCIFISSTKGKIEIGDDSHIGIGTIMQGHSKIIIGKNFTTSAGCKLYSTSNNPNKCHSGTLGHSDLKENELNIGNNVWLGLNVIMLNGKVGDNVFIKPNSVITKDISENSIAGGNPCIKIKARY